VGNRVVEPTTNPMRVTLPALLVLSLLPLSSCLAVAAGAAGFGYYRYANNEETRDFRAELEEVWAAGEEALVRLGHPSSEKITRNATVWVMDAETYRMSVERHVDEKTRVRIRVGTFESSENRRQAQLIVQEIGEILAKDANIGEWSEKVRALSEPDPEAETKPQAK
jgi:hypothetical protein